MLKAAEDTYTEPKTASTFWAEPLLQENNDIARTIRLIPWERACPRIHTETGELTPAFDDLSSGASAEPTPLRRARFSITLCIWA